MDDRRFDDLTRALVNPSSRRGALRLLAGALAALPLLRPDGAAACAPPGGKCNPNRPGKCCSGKCSPKGTCLCTKASQCPRPPACKKAVCTGTGKCTTQNKPAGAGCDDGDPCTVDDTCDGNGVCEPGTPMQCNGGKQCVNGNCECPTGQGDCEGTGICGPLGSDPNYCGSCTNRCSGGEVCQNGQCVCNGINCGTQCTCFGGKVCQNGRCECPSGQGDCAGTGVCGSLQNDPNYCGSCTTKCKTDQTCRDGACVCDGSRCGDGCGCSGGKVCQNGRCECPAGYGDCKGTGICGSLGSDPNYCGSCTNKCKTDQICRNGQCVCDGTRCGDGCQCSPGKVCQNGECVCDGTSCRNGCVCENPEDRCLNGVCLPQT